MATQPKNSQALTGRAPRLSVAGRLGAAASIDVSPTTATPTLAQSSTIITFGKCRTFYLRLTCAVPPTPAEPTSAPLRTHASSPCVWQRDRVLVFSCLLYFCHASFPLDSFRSRFAIMPGELKRARDSRPINNRAGARRQLASMPHPPATTTAVSHDHPEVI